MTTATLTAALPSVNVLGFLAMFARAFTNAKRYEHLFAMSESQLQSRGLDRDMLTRSYISGLGRN